MSQKLLKSGFIVLVGTFLYKFAFLLKDILLTSKMGVGSELTLFVTAFIIPSFLSNTFAQSLQVTASNYIFKSNNTVSIPYLKSVLLKTLSICTIGYSILYLLIPVIFTSFTSQDTDQLRILSLLSLPFFIFMAPRGVLGQVLYLRQKHLLNFSLAIVSPAALIVYILITNAPTAMQLMMTLSIGSVAEFLIVYFIANAVGGISNEAMQGKHAIKSSEMFRGFALQMLLMLPPLVDQILAHFNGSKFLTIFNYAIKIPNIITTISMIVSGSVLLPFFISNKESEVTKKPSKNILLFFGLGFISFLVAIPFVSPLLVKIIYLRGKFTLEDSHQVSLIQSYYFLSAPLTAIFMVYVRYLNAHMRNKEAIQISFSVVTVSVIVGGIFCLMNAYEYIPFSIIVSYFVTFLFFKLKLSNKS